MATVCLAGTRDIPRTCEELRRLVKVRYRSCSAPEPGGRAIWLRGIFHNGTGRLVGAGTAGGLKVSHVKPGVVARSIDVGGSGTWGSVRRHSTAVVDFFDIRGEKLHVPAGATVTNVDGPASDGGYYTGRYSYARNGPLECSFSAELWPRTVWSVTRLGYGAGLGRS